MRDNGKISQLVCSALYPREHLQKKWVQSGHNDQDIVRAAGFQMLGQEVGTITHLISHRPNPLDGPETQKMRFVERATDRRR